MSYIVMGGKGNGFWTALHSEDYGHTWYAAVKKKKEKKRKRSGEKKKSKKSKKAKKKKKARE